MAPGSMIGSVRAATAVRRGRNRRDPGKGNTSMARPAHRPTAGSGLNRRGASLPSRERGMLGQGPCPAAGSSPNEATALAIPIGTASPSDRRGVPGGVPIGPRAATERTQSPRRRNEANSSGRRNEPNLPGGRNEPNSSRRRNEANSRPDRTNPTLRLDGPRPGRVRWPGSGRGSGRRPRPSRRGRARRRGTGRPRRRAGPGRSPWRCS